MADPFVQELQIGTIKFEDTTIVDKYSYLPPRSAVTIKRERAITTGQNINGLNYYLIAEQLSHPVMTIESPDGYGIPGTLAKGLMDLWKLPNPVATPFTVIENYSTFDGTTETWNKCIMIEEPVFEPLAGQDLRLYYTYRLTILLIK